MCGGTFRESEDFSSGDLLEAKSIWRGKPGIPGSVRVVAKGTEDFNYAGAAGVRKRDCYRLEVLELPQDPGQHTWRLGETTEAWADEAHQIYQRKLAPA